MPQIKLYLGSIWHIAINPEEFDRHKSLITAIESGALAVEEGRIIYSGQQGLAKQKYPNAEVIDFADRLILPGFIDTHVHMPQLDLIGSYSPNLLDWLDKFTFPLEAKFSDPEIAKHTSNRFIKELLANGVSLSMIFSSSHETATDILFETADNLGLKAIIGKVSMDQNAPSSILQKSQDDLKSTRNLIEKWHKKENRLFYALTPRFAITASEKLFNSLRQIKNEFPDLWIQTHFSESTEEVELVKKIYPACKNYLEVYKQFDLLGSKTMLAHCIHANKDEIEVINALSVSLSHCPTSNLFLGSGLMPLCHYLDSNIKVSLGSDVGAGTSLSPWRTMEEAYKVQALLGTSISPSSLFYLSTLGGAYALGLHESTGNFAIGKDADFQVIDLKRIPSLKERFLHKKIDPNTDFLPIVMSTDNRIVNKLFIRGREVYSNP
ncbi:MAG: guanine deaminase [Bdellovibrionota bacterium]